MFSCVSQVGIEGQRIIGPHAVQEASQSCCSNIDDWIYIDNVREGHMMRKKHWIVVVLALRMAVVDLLGSKVESI